MREKPSLRHRYRSRRWTPITIRWGLTLNSSFGIRAFGEKRRSQLIVAGARRGLDQCEIDQVALGVAAAETVGVASDRP